MAARRPPPPPSSLVRRVESSGNAPGCCPVAPAAAADPPGRKPVAELSEARAPLRFQALALAMPGRPRHAQRDQHQGRGDRQAAALAPLRRVLVSARAGTRKHEPRKAPTSASVHHSHWQHEVCPWLAPCRQNKREVTAMDVALLLAASKEHTLLDSGSVQKTSYFYHWSPATLQGARACFHQGRGAEAGGAPVRHRRSPRAAWPSRAAQGRQASVCCRSSRGRWTAASPWWPPSPTATSTRAPAWRSPAARRGAGRLATATAAAGRPAAAWTAGPSRGTG